MIAGAPRDPAVSFVCPACKGSLDHVEDSYTCEACSRTYPVLYGIPDFRLRSDRYLTLEEEREKAGHLHTFAQESTFGELIAHYYSITDDVPPELAQRYQAYILNAPAQASATIDRLSHDRENSTLLDMGCGAGGFLVAASGRFRSVVGADIALRWLVICRKRLQEAGILATLVCCDVESPPFADAAFSHVVASDLVEHVYDTEATIRQCYRLLHPDGLLWLTATNRYCIGPHPLTRIWAIGFLPRKWRSLVLQKIRGVDSLRYTTLVSPGEVMRTCRRAGFRELHVGPKRPVTENIAFYPRQDRILIRTYNFLLGIPVLRKLLLRVGPAFECTCRK